MNETFESFVAPKDVPYTKNGRNLAEMRRADLHQLAKALDCDDVSYTRNDLVKALCSKLHSMDAPAEINEMAKPKAKKKVSKKK